MMSAYHRQLYTFVWTIKSWKQGVQLDEHIDMDSKFILDMPWSFYDVVFYSQLAEYF